ncbi:MAG: ATP-binding protein [Acidaminococcaceae bacterium]|jgi:signal transduction histidine kinase|nr:ATP-binding protein [Acidaminococcaceae bacterium]
MKNKIFIKMFLAFAFALLVFSLVVGSGFGYLFRQHVISVKKQDMEQRAVKIAQALGESRDQWLVWQAKRKEAQVQGKNSNLPGPLAPAAVRPQGPMGLNFSAVLRFLGSAAADDVWIVDNNQHLTSTGNMQGKHTSFMFKDLPPDAAKVVDKVMQGNVTTSEGFSTMLEVPTLTVGSPVRDKDGNILGAVLVHAPISGMEEAATQGNRILLMCGGIALLLSFIMAFGFSWWFTKPLRTMQLTAEEMTEGDYAARCNVRQNDEVGELGKALDTLGDKLLVASKESAQLDQLRKDFIANISHELRTPVTVIRGSLEALCDRVVTEPEQVSEYHEEMLKETLFLQRLINDLLDLSRLQNTNFKIEMTKVNLYDILQDVYHSGARLAQDKNINITFVTDNKLYPLMGDYGRIRQMFMVFVDNSIKFSPAGSRVEVTMSGRTVKVTDHGCGVPDHELAHIFDRFYKTRNEKNKTGTGLGLSIAREIAERHHMEVHMESKPAVATSVVVSLPEPLAADAQC